MSEENFEAGQADKVAELRSLLTTLIEVSALQAAYEPYWKGRRDAYHELLTFFCDEETHE
jgi:hypothetical protein